ncbi:MAG TPA: hypothetical protein VID76_09940 [Solirubrobacterales bacterium]
MSPGDVRSAALMEFADGNRLRFAARAELPTSGGLLGAEGLKQKGAASGALPGGEPGTVCDLTYTYRSNDSTHTVERTAVVLKVPESIGFAPYLGSGGGRGSGGHSAKAVDLDGGGKLLADEGINDGWLAELLSPAFTEWLARSPEGFAWELSDGVLCASRDGFVTEQPELTRLCEDAAHIAATIREECVEEVEAGEAPRTAAKAKAPDGTARLAAMILDRTTFDKPPKDVAEARPKFRRLAVRHPSTYFIALLMTFAWMLGVNIIGGGIFGLLLNLPDPGRAVLIFELCLFVIIGYLCLRSQINGISSKLAGEGFWREYARTRALTFEDPIGFAASHAKAGLPGTPVRVMTGAFEGVGGSLMITGDGLKRGDSIALVAGPDGPIATADFDVSAPGASAEALDSYAQRLAAELKQPR